MNLSNCLSLANKIFKKHIITCISKTFNWFILATILIAILLFIQKRVEISILSLHITTISISLILTYTFWKIYLINCTMVPAAYDFIKNDGKITFKELYKQIKQSELIKFLTVISIYSLIPLVLILYFAIIATKIVSSNILFISLLSSSVAMLITGLILLPFLTFCYQALYFRQEDETYNKMFINCYKAFDFKIFIIALICCTIYNVMAFIPIIGTFIAVIFWFYTTILFTLIYYSKLQKIYNE